MNTRASDQHPDTPGHQDFSEDTYRTLMAVDAAVMVIDSARGIEPQTKKLFKVVRQRGIPVFTFMNKLDRDGREPLDLVAELEEVLGIEGVAMNWPIGMGQSLLGLYDLANQRVELYHPEEGQDRFIALADGKAPAGSPLADDPQFEETLGEIELLEGAGASLTGQRFWPASRLQSGVFGSALTNFGVETFLEQFVDLAPAPGEHEVNGDEELKPDDDEFSGFIFKIQANMNPQHRDRTAFVRVCSGGNSARAWTHPGFRTRQAGPLEQCR